ncbi:MAG TPA: ABC transporter permease [Acidimicrobiales bacterium]|nr:ABC transporter permease [Acidimicrobiales bacterium]
MSAVLSIARASLTRIARDRMGLFFMVLLPVLVILIVGATVRGFTTFRVGVVDLGGGSAGSHLTTALAHDPSLVVVHYPSASAADTAVARGEVNTAVIIPADLDIRVRAGQPTTVAVIAEQANNGQQAAASAVGAVVARQGGQLQAASFTVAQAGGDFDRALALAGSIAPHVSQVGVTATQADSSAAILPEGFSYSAPTMLVLFVFINALAGGGQIIENRRIGMYERMSSAPIRARTIIAGETLTYTSTALLQAVLIVVVGAALFGVSWGNPPAALCLIVLWALVGAGAGMLAGTLFRTPEQATSIGPAMGIALGMLGGCMWPLAIVNGTMRQIGHVAPQAWAVDAWTTLLARHGTLPAITRPLLILAAFAAAFLSLATLRLRRILS